MLDVVSTQSGLQRSFGRGEVCFGTSGLRRLYQKGCAKILLPKTYGSMAEAVIVNTAGGLTGGDVFEVSCGAEKGAALCVTSQTAERVYRARNGEAEIVNVLQLAAESNLEWLPQETILFQGSALTRRLKVNMAGSGRFLALESVVLGRKASGEILSDCRFSDQWRIHRDGQLIYADGMRFGPEVTDLFGRSAVFGEARAYASLVYVAPDAGDRIVAVRDFLVKLDVKVELAASTWNGVLVVRFLAKEAQILREALVAYLRWFRGRDVPKVWYL